jgi:hypothetical protein
VRAESDCIEKTDDFEPGTGTIRAMEGLVELGMTPKQAIVAGGAQTSGPSSVVSADADRSKLDEIVVTADKRAEKMLNVPNSIDDRSYTGMQCLSTIRRCLNSYLFSRGRSVSADYRF